MSRAKEEHRIGGWEVAPKLSIWAVPSHDHTRTNDDASTIAGRPRYVIFHLLQDQPEASRPARMQLLLPDSKGVMFV